MFVRPVPARSSWHAHDFNASSVLEIMHLKHFQSFYSWRPSGTRPPSCCCADHNEKTSASHSDALAVNTVDISGSLQQADLHAVALQYRYHHSNSKHVKTADSFARLVSKPPEQPLGSPRR